MKIMRFVFVVLAFVLAGRAPSAQGQTTEQVMTFSIICQYTTNLYATNLAARATNELLTQENELTTVALNSENLVKAMAIDLFGGGTNWLPWAGAQICYEVNLSNTNTGIFLRKGTNQVNVTQFFNNPYSSNAISSLFSTTATNVFNGTNLLTNGTLPLMAGVTHYEGTNPVPTSVDHTSIDNLAYVSFSTSNISFALFGYSEGTLVPFEAHGVLYHSPTLIQGTVYGAGTFSLNLTTNVYFVATNSAVVPAVPNTNYFGTGLAHGLIIVQKAFDLDIGPPEGP